MEVVNNNNLIGEIECKNVLKNFIKMAVSIICYLRNLFSESVFEDAKIGDLHLKRLTRSIPESSNLIDWIDYGVYDTIIKEYLKALIITIHDTSNVPLESYYLTLIPISISNQKGKEYISKDLIKNNTVKSLKELILLIQSLSPLYDNSYLSIKLLYFDNVPASYEPRFFKPDHNTVNNMPIIPITKLNNGYNEVQIDLYTIATINEYSTNYLTKSTSKHTTCTRDGSISSPTSTDNDENDEILILELINKSEGLSKSCKYITKSLISTGLGVNVSIAKVLIKKLMEKGIIETKYIKNKGYESKLYINK
ncbi:HORMA domain protein [Theileria parva strain Muguga]|uniref:HORMA domain protein n=1 Tax=Theileria parva strain Muguga TaxID=333668 RepID=UPI001C62382A|nr:HORMA domain protein [Theileria parva strain Muguga]EAN31701.2 HORMA domain protein [Theileria parva strain Muguga]